MQITKNVKKQVKVVEIKDIFCNLCGSSCKTANSKDRLDKNGNIVEGKKTEDNIYGGLLETEVDGFYNSSHLEDRTSYKFSLCEDCLVKMFKKFKVPVEMKSNGIEEYLPEAKFREAERKMNDEMNNHYNEKQDLKFKAQQLSDKLATVGITYSKAEYQRAARSAVERSKSRQIRSNKKDR